MHGISSWFDAYFIGSSQEVVLSTSPYNPPTHWYQVRLLLPEPLAINKGQKIVGSLIFKANNIRSYYIYLKIGIQELNLWMENVYDLKDPEFRGYSGYTFKPSQNN
jgi:histone-arginine methyltransferase CARM1